MECQQAIRLWKLNPVYEEIFSLAKEEGPPDYPEMG